MNRAGLFFQSCVFVPLDGRVLCRRLGSAFGSGVSSEVALEVSMFKLRPAP